MRKLARYALGTTAASDRCIPDQMRGATAGHLILQAVKDGGGARRYE
jgi:hypothetical protein